MKENLSHFFNEVKTEVDAIDDFPDQVEDPIVRELGKTEPVVSIAITGSMESTDLKDYCEDLKDTLQRDDSVSQVVIEGFSDRQIRLEISQLKMMKYGLSIDDIAEIIRAQNLDLPLGIIQNQEQEWVLRFINENKRVSEYEQIPIIAGEGGGEVLLGDIASIQEQFELDEDKIIFNGERAGRLVVLKTKEEDSIRVLESVRQFIEEQQQLAPPGVKFTLTQDIASIVQDRIQMIAINGIEGLILVFVVMWMFFNFRFAFWVSMGLPISFFAAFFVMMVMGLSVNMLSLVGFLIALGLLMDDSIVLSENIAAHYQRTGKALESAIAGTKEVGIGVLSSFATTICVFLPLAFLEGNIGKILRVMPMVLIATLTVSLIEAFLILPNHLSHSLSHKKKESSNSIRRKIADLIEYCRESIVKPFVERAIKQRELTVGLTLFVFIVSLGFVAGGFLKFQAFPDLDGDVALARVLLPQGTPLNHTQHVVKQLTDALDTINQEFSLKQPNRQSLVKHISVDYSRNQDAHEIGPHVATIAVDLLEAETRSTSLDEFFVRWREEVGTIPDVIQLTYTEPAIGPAGRPFDIRIAGEDLIQMKQGAMDMQQQLASYRGAVDIIDDLRPGRRELQVTLKPGATGLGLNSMMLAGQLRSAVYGKTASEIQVRGDTIEIDVRSTFDDRNQLSDIETYYITLPDGSQVPLNMVTDLKEGRGWGAYPSYRSTASCERSGKPCYFRREFRSDSCRYSRKLLTDFSRKIS
jgi:HAE1 family hydrophobic/amphiphilic exporter-1